MYIWNKNNSRMSMSELIQYRPFVSMHCKLHAIQTQARDILSINTTKVGQLNLLINF